LLPAGANIAAAVFEGDEGEIQLIFQALAEDQVVRIHSNPIILTVEGHPAQLKAGDDVPFLSRAVLGNTETFVSESAQTGVNLLITPTVSYMDMDVEQEKPYITIRLDAELSSVTRFREEEGFTQPIIDNRQYKTVVCLREDERILIGGLFRDSQVKTTRGIPILRDIPVLGRLFRSSSDKRTISQLFVMIRPMLLDIWTEGGADQRFMDGDVFRDTREMLERGAEEMDHDPSPFEEFRELFIDHGTPD
jgi:general secretion pathway protein D